MDPIQTTPRGPPASGWAASLGIGQIKTPASGKLFTSMELDKRPNRLEAFSGLCAPLASNNDKCRLMMEMERPSRHHFGGGQPL